MSGYEVEHNIAGETNKSAPPPRRPDLSTFFSTLELIDTSDAQAHTNVHAVPQPENVAAAHRLLINAYQMMRGRVPDESGEARRDAGGDDLLGSMIELLVQGADDPPTQLKGVPNTFLDQLERVPKKSLKPTDTCPICVNPFLDDPYPLVVELPCHKDHRFDLDCIAPWLKLNSTCPLDRKELLKKKEPPKPAPDEEEEDYDEMYA